MDGKTSRSMQIELFLILNADMVFASTVYGSAISGK
jgi:hypothetical protein